MSQPIYATVATKCCECGQPIQHGEFTYAVAGEVFCGWECSQADPCVPRNQRLEFAALVQSLTRHGVQVRA